MSGIVGSLYELYIRFMVWLGAAPPPGYEHLLPAGEAKAQPYTLKPGDTLFSVARRFGVHYERVAQANGLADPSEARPGQTIIIPPAGWTPADGPLQVLKPSAPPAPVPQPATPSAPIPPDRPTQPVKIQPAPEPEPVSLPVEEETAVAEEPPAGPVKAPVVETEPALPFEAEEILLPPFETIAATPPPPAEAPALVEATAAQEFRYTVQRGDTLHSIARRYNVTVKDLIEANHITDPNRIFPDQKLIIPGYLSPKPEPEPEPETPQPPRPQPPGDHIIHTIVRGDTLTAIAKRYGITLRQLIEVNQIENPNLIRVGQRLIIPGGGHPPEPEPEPEPEPTPAPPPVVTDPQFPPLGPPQAVRALYVSYFAVGHQDFRRRVFQLLDTTEFNAVVIDAKGDHGLISYPTQVALAHEIGAARPTARDFGELMARFKERGVYTIARIVTFKDTPLAKSRPELAVKTTDGSLWQDREELYWSDPFLKPGWDYITQVAVEAAQMGFDEIQFDYVRFPTPSQMGQPQFSQEVTRDTRVAAITGFLSTVHGQLKPLGVKVAADTFGYTCWRKDDTLIGQDIERMAEYLDVLSPMLYPSTFGAGIPGYKFAIAHPYEIVYESARRAVDRVAPAGCMVRPWIQDFPDYRFDKRIYGRAEIQAQIKGCFDAGATGFMVWDPRVRYTDGAYAPVRVAAG